ncbi:MAG: hypothetical protein IPG17_30010 [Sandaracinaceae bacterium]|nr:hypothetical protein [Sandaracinaceae bacterium]MBK7777802.1 hypothetical protein [Sandaracinaceae bacterium]MBK8408065.1 hypothetical protein [Sandaracinaceae bacterium]MBP7684595.1 hypothetical protein [Deltaproteobacteria bacterium]
MLYAPEDQAVKEETAAAIHEALVLMLHAADDGATARELEEHVWKTSLEFGRALMSAGLRRMCARATAQDIKERGLDPKQVTLRLDGDYHATLSTTLGPVTFPWFAYRDRSAAAATVTHTPAKTAVLPLFKHCRSSELLLEWESRLGSDHPFRHAQEALSYFTHGAAHREDTTIARHMVTVGSLVSREWTYRTPEDIAHLLLTRATRDPKTGRPLLYASTDAHALRTYVDDTWDAQWKMANGVRVWCIDRHNGSTIHLGGEYTWGNCEKVQETFEWLRDTGRMPADGRMVNGLNVQVVLVTDGAPWIKERLVPLFPKAVVLLDAYHLLEALAKYATARFLAGTASNKLFYQRALDALFGKSRGKKPAMPKPRRGHTKRSCQPIAASTMPADDAPHARRRKRSPAADRLLGLLAEGVVPPTVEDEHNKLVAAINHNADRIDYEQWRPRGYQIGSGAMESLHRTGSQTRLKVAGIRCLPETSQAIFNLRMLRLCGRWDEFWRQDDITSSLVAAFGARTLKLATTLEAAAADAAETYQHAA